MSTNHEDDLQDRAHLCMQALHGIDDPEVFMTVVLSVIKAHEEYRAGKAARMPLMWAIETLDKHLKGNHNGAPQTQTRKDFSQASEETQTKAQGQT